MSSCLAKTERTEVDLDVLSSTHFRYKTLFRVHKYMYSSTLWFSNNFWREFCWLYNAMMSCKFVCIQYSSSFFFSFFFFYYSFFFLIYSSFSSFFSTYYYYYHFLFLRLLLIIITEQLYSMTKCRSKSCRML